MRGNETKPRRVREDYRMTEDIKVRHLQPSRELLEHYRSKLQKLDSDFESVSEVVRDCQAVCGDVSKLQQELLEKDNELSQLQQAISDLQVYVFQERHQVLTLYADNDRLKIKNAELLRRNEVLHSISGVSEEELTLFVKKSSSGSITVPRRTKHKSVKGENSGDAVMGDVASSDEVVLLQLRVQALEAQLTEQRQLHQDEITALRQDRELQRAERVAERRKQQQTMDELAAQLEGARQQICKISSELVRSRKQHLGVEAAWLSERETLFKVAKEECGHRHPTNRSVVLPGGGSKGCGIEAVLREQLAERERLLATYQEQCVVMEAQVTRLHQQAETSKALFKDKVQKMVSQVSYLRTKYAELDRRRILEAEGFRSDIRLMRTRLRELERGFSKMGAAQGAGPSKRSASETSSNVCLTSTGVSTGVSTGLASTAMDTMHRARQLQVELKKIRNKVSNLESELQHENEKSSTELL